MYGFHYRNEGPLMPDCVDMETGVFIKFCKNSIYSATFFCLVYLPVFCIMMKKLTVILMVLLLAIVILAGCSHHSAGPNINDQMSSHKNLRYHRIIAATPAMEEIVLGLVEPEQMAAVSDYSRKSKFPKIAAKAKKVKGVISTKPSTESIIAQKPDVVLLPVVFGKTQAETLRDCGLHVIPLDVPEGYENIKKRIQFIADQLGESENGKRMTARMDEKVNRVRAAVKNIPAKKIAVGYAVNGAFGRKNGAFDNICNEAGVLNGAGLLNMKRGEQLSKEQILELNPDVIICSADATSSKMWQEVLQDPSFKNIKAIQNKNVFMLEERYMNSTTQFFAESVEMMAKTVYPECFNHEP